MNSGERKIAHAVAMDDAEPVAVLISIGPIGRGRQDRRCRMLFPYDMIQLDFIFDARRLA